MKIFKLFAAVAACALFAFAPCTAGCEEGRGVRPSTAEETETPEIEEEVEIGVGGEIEEEIEVEIEEEVGGEEQAAEQPTAARVRYVCVTGEGVNLRSGAGRQFARLGVAGKGTLYALCGEEDGWYRTRYCGRDAYVSGAYCSLVEMDEGSGDVESVVRAGCDLLGTKYVYGAVRYMDGRGRRLDGFKITEFDCSSLMQYIFKAGADVNLQVNTRTQIFQGARVEADELRRGDLMFFTNASRRNNTGVERVGHVALYLGDGYILHTASDYAKIEKLSSTRLSYFIEGRRVL